MSWLAYRTLRVYETEDLALVFSIRPAWFIPVACTVRDADGKSVGTLLRVARTRLYLAPGRAATGRPRSAVLHEAMKGQALGWTGRYTCGGDSELATVADSPRGTLLTFAAPVRNDPFVKMMLLAATLVKQ